MKGKIHEFNPIIYPTRLWVSYLPDARMVDKIFLFLDDDDEVVENTREEISKHSTAICTTFSVVEKKTKWMGCLVIIFRKAEADVGIIAHEAGHCTDWLCDHLGVSGFSFREGEARQYYTQWVANCIDKVLKNKVR